jgi:hypothetical protein
LALPLLPNAPRASGSFVRFDVTCLRLPIGGE